MAVGCEMGAGYLKGLQGSAWPFLPLCSLSAARSGGPWPSQRDPAWWGVALPHSGEQNTRVM